MVNTLLGPESSSRLLLLYILRIMWPAWLHAIDKGRRKTTGLLFETSVGNTVLAPNSSNMRERTKIKLT